MILSQYGEVGILQLAVSLLLFGGNRAIPSVNHGLDNLTSIKRPLVIAHRGSSGTHPEHSIEAYVKAIEVGADVIECDVSITKDLALVCLHEAWLSDVTDARDKFPNRIATYYVHDHKKNITDVFSVDLTLTELKTLRLKQRFNFRDPSFNYKFGIPTFTDYLQLAKDRHVAVEPELKNPEWVNSLHIVKDSRRTFEELFLETLHRFHTSPTAPCVIQCFYEPSLILMRPKTNLPLLYLLWTDAVVSDVNLKRWQEEGFYGIGPVKSLIAMTGNDGKVITGVSDLIQRAHNHGLKVHPYTFRNEDRFLAWKYEQDIYVELGAFVNLGADGLFTDFPETFHNFLQSNYTKTCNSAMSWTSRRVLWVGLGTYLCMRLLG